MSVTIKGSNLLGGGSKVKTLTLAGSAPASILAQTNTQIVVKLANAAPKQGLVVITADTGAVITSAADAFEYVGSATTTTAATSTPKQLVPGGGDLGLDKLATTKAPVEADSGPAAGCEYTRLLRCSPNSMNSCYNLVDVVTGSGKERWELKVYGNRTVQVRLNGVLVDPADPAVDACGAIGFGISPRADTKHSIFV